MSAYFSIARPDGLAMFTDGAAADPETGNLAADICKVVTGDGVAVTGCGPAEIVLKVAEAFCAWSDEVGINAAIVGVQDFAANVRDELAGDRRGFEILIGAYLPGIGGVHRSFFSEPIHIRQTDKKFAAFEVFNIGIVANSIGRLSAEQVVQFHPRNGSLEVCARRDGLGIMQWMREIPTEGGSWCIGGHCDMTLITAEGVTEECIHRWPDVIGQLIEP